MPRTQIEMETDIEGCFWLKGNLSIDTTIEGYYYRRRRRKVRFESNSCKIVAITFLLFLTYK